MRRARRRAWRSMMLRKRRWVSRSVDAGDQGFGVAAERAQRRANFVGQVGDEIRAHGLVGLELGDVVKHQHPGRRRAGVGAHGRGVRREIVRRGALNLKLGADHPVVRRRAHRARDELLQARVAAELDERAAAVVGVAVKREHAAAPRR